METQLHRASDSKRYRTHAPAAPTGHPWLMSVKGALYVDLAEHASLAEWTRRRLRPMLLTLKLTIWSRLLIAEAIILVMVSQLALDETPTLMSYVMVSFSLTGALMAFGSLGLEHQARRTGLHKLPPKTRAYDEALQTVAVFAFVHLLLKAEELPRSIPEGAVASAAERVDPDHMAATAVQILRMGDGTSDLAAQMQKVNYALHDYLQTTTGLEMATIGKS